MYIGDHVFNKIYFIIITITTVGYGDYSPQTRPGKIIAMVTALWGAILISLVVVAATQIFYMSDDQEKALREIDVSRKAANSIACAFKYYKQKKQLQFLREWSEPGFQSNFLDGLKSRNLYNKDEIKVDVVKSFHQRTNNDVKGSLNIDKFQLGKKEHRGLIRGQFNITA